MPYSGSDDKSLPSHIKKLPTNKRRMWVNVFNIVFNTCRRKKGSVKDCEAKAFKQANGVVKD